ncbi:MAG TPA: hypothetical protein VFK05_17130 [Polyangiaceae bacterium]|nr:hypothetical protein [Polyangiaceae bacterium]
MVTRHFANVTAFGVGLCLLTACGGKAGSAQSVQPGSGGGAPNAGSDNGDAGSSVAANGGAAGSATSGGSGGAAGALSAPSGGNGGTGGKVPDPVAGNGGTAGRAPDPMAGSGGENPLACSTPYSGPVSSPRSDGPPDADCANIAESIILSRSRDRWARAPQGYYYEPSDSIAFWNEPCSKSVDETVSRGPTDGMGTFLASYSNDWFYEAAYCFNGVRRLERNLRCDYFDGSTLAKPPTNARLRFLAGLLWWSKNQNLSNAAIIGHSDIVGDTFDILQLCTVSTARGDFGSCDELRVESTDYHLSLNGMVVIDEPKLVRTLEGECH